MRALVKDFVPQVLRHSLRILHNATHSLAQPIESVGALEIRNDHKSILSVRLDPHLLRL